MIQNIDSSFVWNLFMQQSHNQVKMAETKKKMKRYTLDEVKDKFIGKRGTLEREEYEMDLKIELIGDMIKRIRKERNLTQSELGELIGVQKAQISKLENNTKNVSIGTIMKVFDALKARVKLQIELIDKEVEIA